MCTQSHPRLFHLLFLSLSWYTAVLTLILKPRQDVAMRNQYSVGSGGEETCNRKKGENGREKRGDRKKWKERQNFFNVQVEWGLAVHSPWVPHLLFIVIPFFPQFLFPNFSYLLTQGLGLVHGKFRNKPFTDCLKYFLFEWGETASICLPG